MTRAEHIVIIMLLVFVFVLGVLYGWLLPKDDSLTIQMSDPDRVEHVAMLSGEYDSVGVECIGEDLYRVVGRR